MDLTLPSLPYVTFSPSTLILDLTTMDSLINSLVFDMKIDNINLSTLSLGSMIDSFAPLLGYDST